MLWIAFIAVEVELVHVLVSAFHVLVGIVAIPHERVVPGGGIVDVAQVGILEDESLSCGESVLQYAQFRKRELADVHVGVDTMDKLLQIQVPIARKIGMFFLRSLCGDSHA